MNKAQIEYRALSHITAIEHASLSHALIKSRVEVEQVYVDRWGKRIRKFRCPEGTPRGGKWTDAMGSDCYLGGSRLVMNRIGRGLDRWDVALGEAGGRGGAAILNESARGARRAAEIARYVRNRRKPERAKRRGDIIRGDIVDRGLHRVADTIEGWNNAIEDRRKRKNSIVVPDGPRSLPPSTRRRPPRPSARRVDARAESDAAKIRARPLAGKRYGGRFTYRDRAEKRLAELSGENPDLDLHLIKGEDGKYEIVDDDRLESLAERVGTKPLKTFRDGEDITPEGADDEEDAFDRKPPFEEPDTLPAKRPAKTTPTEDEKEPNVLDLVGDRYADLREDAVTDRELMDPARKIFEGLDTEDAIDKAAEPEVRKLNDEALQLQDKYNKARAADPEYDPTKDEALVAKVEDNYRRTAAFEAAYREALNATKGKKGKRGRGRRTDRTPESIAAAELADSATPEPDISATPDAAVSSKTDSTPPSFLGETFGWRPDMADLWDRVTGEMTDEDWAYVHQEAVKDAEERLFDFYRGFGDMAEAEQEFSDDASRFMADTIYHLNDDVKNLGPDKTIDDVTLDDVRDTVLNAKIDLLAHAMAMNKRRRDLSVKAPTGERIDLADLPPGRVKKFTGIRPGIDDAVVPDGATNSPLDVAADAFNIAEQAPEGIDVPEDIVPAPDLGDTSDDPLFGLSAGTPIPPGLATSDWEGILDDGELALLRDLHSAIVDDKIEGADLRKTWNAVTRQAEKEAAENYSIGFGVIENIDDLQNIVRAENQKLKEALRDHLLPYSTTVRGRDSDRSGPATPTFNRDMLDALVRDYGTYVGRRKALSFEGDTAAHRLANGVQRTTSDELQAQRRIEDIAAAVGVPVPSSPRGGAAAWRESLGDLYDGLLYSRHPDPEKIREEIDDFHQTFMEDIMNERENLVATVLANRDPAEISSIDDIRNLAKIDDATIKRFDELRSKQRAAIEAYALALERLNLYRRETRPEQFPKSLRLNPSEDNQGLKIDSGFPDLGNIRGLHELTIPSQDLLDQLVPGAEGDPFAVEGMDLLDLPNKVNIVVLNSKGEVLMSHPKPYGSGPDASGYNFHLPTGEPRTQSQRENLFGAARRTVKEQTGLDIDIIDTDPEIIPWAHGRHAVVYARLRAGDSAAANLPSNAKFVPLSQVQHTVMGGDGPDYEQSVAARALHDKLTGKISAYVRDRDGDPYESPIAPIFSKIAAWADSDGNTAEYLAPSRRLGLPELAEVEPRDVAGTMVPSSKDTLKTQISATNRFLDKVESLGDRFLDDEAWDKWKKSEVGRLTDLVNAVNRRAEEHAQNGLPDSRFLALTEMRDGAAQELRLLDAIDRFREDARLKSVLFEEAIRNAQGHPLVLRDLVAGLTADDNKGWPTVKRSARNLTGVEDALRAHVQNEFFRPHAANLFVSDLEHEAALSEEAWRQKIAPSLLLPGARSHILPMSDGRLRDLRVNPETSPIKTREQAARHLEQGGRLEEVPDIFLVDAIHDNLAKPGAKSEFQNINGRFVELTKGRYLGTNDHGGPRGRTVIFKDTHTGLRHVLKNPNQESHEWAQELAANHVLHAVGLPAAGVMLGDRSDRDAVNGNRPVLLGHASDLWGDIPLESAIDSLADWDRRGAKIDPEVFARLMVAEPVIGGFDRHDKNYFVGELPNGNLGIVAIDHGHEFGDVLQKERGVPANISENLQDATEKRRSPFFRGKLFPFWERYSDEEKAHILQRAYEIKQSIDWEGLIPEIKSQLAATGMSDNDLRPLNRAQQRIRDVISDGLWDSTWFDGVIREHGANLPDPRKPSPVAAPRVRGSKSVEEAVQQAASTGHATHVHVDHPSVPSGDVKVNVVSLSGRSADSAAKKRVAKSLDDAIEAATPSSGDGRLFNMPATGRESTAPELDSSLPTWMRQTLDTDEKRRAWAALSDEEQQSLLNSPNEDGEQLSLFNGKSEVIQSRVDASPEVIETAVERLNEPESRSDRSPVFLEGARTPTRDEDGRLNLSDPQSWEPADGLERSDEPLTSEQVSKRLEDGLPVTAVVKPDLNTMVVMTTGDKSSSTPAANTNNSVSTVRVFNGGTDASKENIEKALRDSHVIENDLRYGEEASDETKAAALIRGLAPHDLGSLSAADALDPSQHEQRLAYIKDRFGLGLSDVETYVDSLGRVRVRMTEDGLKKWKRAVKKADGEPPAMVYGFVDLEHLVDDVSAGGFRTPGERLLDDGDGWSAAAVAAADGGGRTFPLEYAWEGSDKDWEGMRQFDFVEEDGEEAGIVLYADDALRQIMPVHHERLDGITDPSSPQWKKIVAAPEFQHFKKAMIPNNAIDKVARKQVAEVEHDGAVPLGGVAGVLIPSSRYDEFLDNLRERGITEVRGIAIGDFFLRATTRNRKLLARRARRFTAPDA